MPIITKSDLDSVLAKTKELETRTEAAEAKVKTLEQDKVDLLATKGLSGQTGNGGGGQMLGQASDEQRALRYFQKSHPRELLDINVGAPKYKHVPDELKMVVLNFKQAVDIARFCAQYFNQESLDMIGRDEKSDRLAIVKSILDTRYGREVLAPAIKAFGSTIAGAGAEWVPTAVATSYLEEYELRRVLEGRFALINMPSNPFDQPKLTNVTKARIALQGQSNFLSNNFGTDKIRFTATKLEEFYVLPEELTEDSAPDFMAAGRDEVVRSQERAAESAIINGDSDGTHQDSDTQAGDANLAEKAWDGLRKRALANSGNGSTYDFSNAAVDETKLGVLRSRLGKFGSNPDELLIVGGPVVYNQLVNLDKVSTVEKFGPMATVLKGALAAYQGIPIVNSEHFREDLNASGVYDGMTTTRAGILMVNTKRFYVGQRRPIRVKLMPDLPGSDRWLLASYRRVTFEGHAQGAVEKSVAYGYNIAK
jgi:hypothetical protein